MSIACSVAVGTWVLESHDKEAMVVGEPVSTSAVAGTPSMHISVIGIVPREIPGSSFAGGLTP